MIRVTIFFVGIFLFLVCQVLSAKPNPPLIDKKFLEFWQESRRDSYPFPPTRYELNLLQNNFVNLFLEKRSISPMVSNWRIQNFNDTSSTVGMKDSVNKGWGAFLYRRDSKSRLFIQTPHTFFDLRTGSIGLRIFMENKVKGLIWNTVHRKVVDMAHSPKTILQSFIRAAAVSDVGSTMVQLHGFSPKKRISQGKPFFDFILSECDRDPSPRLEIIGSCLEEKFPNLRVAVYGDHADFLGGETNIQSRMIRRAFVPTFFIHLEMSPRARLHLDTKKPARDNLLNCLRLGSRDE
jgi:hypothetical protein